MLTIAPPRPTVTRFFDAFAAGDVSQLDTLVTEDVEVSLAGLLYEREVYRGRSGVAAAFREIASRWHRFETTVEDVVEADGRLYLTVNVVMGKYDMASELPVAIVCEVRDGLIASLADDDELYDAA
jgi:ketosteroid isomerase-like protein